MIRFAQTSPDGKRVVFQALGQLWVQDAAGRHGRAALTAQRDHFEYFPSWSRDGKSIVYATCDDEHVRQRARRSGARRRRGPARSRPSRVTTSSRCSRPTASRSSTARGRATTCAARPGAREPGIYVVPRAGGTPSRRWSPTTARCRSSAPRATASSSCGSATRTSARWSRSTLAGADQRTHATSEAATEFRALARRQVARLRRALQRLRHAVRAHRQGGRRRSEGERRAGRAGVEGRRRGPALVGRLAQSPLVARAGALHARAQGGLRLPRRRAGEAPRAAGGRRAPRLRRRRRAGPRARSRWSARGIVTMRRDEARRGDRGRRRRRRRQPHRRRRPARGSRGAGRRPARRSSTSPARRSCPASSTPTGTARRASDRLIPEQSWVNLREPRLRRHDDARPVERHQRDLRRRRAAEGGRRSSRRASSRPARSSTAPRATSRPRSTRWTTRCRTSRRLKAVGAFSVKSYNQPRREQRQQVIAAGARARHDGRARGRLAASRRT